MSAGDQRGEVLCAIVLQREEEFQRVSAPAALRRQISQVVYVVDGVAGVVEQVASGQRHGGPEGAQVVREQEAACHGHTEHLVGRDGDAVGEVGALKVLGARLRVEDDAAAPGPVNMQPEVVRLADGGELCERIEGA